MLDGGAPKVLIKIQSEISGPSSTTDSEPGPATTKKISLKSSRRAGKCWSLLDLLIACLAGASLSSQIKVARSSILNVQVPCEVGLTRGSHMRRKGVLRKFNDRLDRLKESSILTVF